MTNKKRIPQRLVTLLLFFLLSVCCLESSVQAAAYVKASKAAVSTTSSQRGWVKIGKHYYYYNSKGRLLHGRIKYKGNYYFSASNGRRLTGWVKRGKKRYYFDRKTAVMYRNQWAEGKKYKYYFQKSGAALSNKWLTYGGNRYYFKKNCTMATGWQKIGKYYYYFDKSSGVMAKNKWIGRYYVNGSGQRIAKKSSPAKEIDDSHYTYKTATLSIDLQEQSTHGVSYWVAHIKTANPSQLRSALSYGTYGGKRQTTSSAVSSNGGVIGVNGSAFSYKDGKPSPLGMCIKNGILYGDYETSYSVMAVNREGVIYTPQQGLKGKDLLSAGVKDTYNFGPILIKDGKPQPAWAETAKYYPRTAVGMVAPNDYVLLVTNTGSYSGLNHWDMVKIFQSYDCQYAYNLDGGGSSTLYYNGKVMNKLINNEQRPCGDFLYFTN
ncbi:MAG: phosphodiester glycosidase family protein [Eubacteriales bacterium]|nr:phosphodiester glycosidase family protein [Eubacteriales bacterium]